MKKRLCVLLVLILSAFVVFATLQKNHVYGFVYENKYFSSLVDAINTNTSYENTKKIYNQVITNLGNDIVTTLRCKTAYIEYVNSLNIKGTKSELKEILNSCYDDLEKLEKSNTIDAIKDTLKFLVYGIDYRVTGNLIKGQKSISLIDDSYEKNSNDAGIMLLFAQRKAEAPAIGGRDKNLALSVLNELLKNIDSYTTAFKFAVYTELGYVYKDTDSSKSDNYYKLAKDLY